MQPLRLGKHGAGRLDSNDFQPTRGEPGRIAQFPLIGPTRFLGMGTTRFPEFGTTRFPQLGTTGGAWFDAPSGCNGVVFRCRKKKETEGFARRPG